MSRELKFRAWAEGDMHFMPLEGLYGMTRLFGFLDTCVDNPKIMQFTGLLDKNGVEIYFDDVLRFSDKWEWYRVQYGPKLMFADNKRKAALMKQFEAEPFEQRVVSTIQDYEWILSREVQTDWEVIGNIHESPELLK